jgi:bifunctional UDP-N-acetylglucosamine pyrophosphorylase / glucosamine-1-phosphate N-acetyltransferase
MPLRNLAGIILAAGKGTRMKSDLPKGLHAVCGLPIVEWIGRAMRGAGVERPVAVVGHGGDLICDALGGGYDYVWQREQLGTGHAALMARELLCDHRGPVVVAPGDTPLLTADALAHLAQRQVETGAGCVVATFRLSDPTGYGRIVRAADTSIRSIVEHRDATPAQLELHEVNPSVYCFDAAVLWDVLPALSNANSQGEYYLTDAIEAIVANGGRVEADLFEDSDLFLGVNDRWQLAEAETALRRRILRRHALEGVTLADPSTTFVGPDVTIGPDTRIEACTEIHGRTTVGAGCRIGPFTRIEDSQIGAGCVILMSQVAQVRMETNARCGPYAHLRPGTVLGEGTRIGNFVEVKNANLAAGVSANHLAYVGDAEVGARTNIGAGMITCNYDGFSKHRTVIGAGAFIGSNSTLVAPVNIGDGAVIAAGSTITHDVPEDALGIGRSRTEIKEGWASQWRKRRHRTG